TPRAILSPMSCIEEEFPCASGDCVPLTSVCDGSADCNDSSDEAPELCVQPTKYQNYSLGVGVKNHSPQLYNFPRVPNEQITASSYYKDAYPHNARFGYWKNWAADTWDIQYPWLKVDIGYPSYVVRVWAHGNQKDLAYIKEFELEMGLKDDQLEPVLTPEGNKM
ncbi:predicted protein, partial [Nematostella vectensis]